MNKVLEFWSIAPHIPWPHCWCSLCCCRISNVVCDLGRISGGLGLRILTLRLRLIIYSYVKKPPCWKETHGIKYQIVNFPFSMLYCTRFFRVLPWIFAMKIWSDIWGIMMRNSAACFFHDKKVGLLWVGQWKVRDLWSRFGVSSKIPTTIMGRDEGARIEPFYDNKDSHADGDGECSVRRCWWEHQVLQQAEWLVQIGWKLTHTLQRNSLPARLIWCWQDDACFFSPYCWLSNPATCCSYMTRIWIGDRGTHAWWVW